MKSIRLAGVVAGLTMSLMLAGCGDVYRPVVIPEPTQGGDPQLQSFVFSLNQGVQLQDETKNGVLLHAGDPCAPTSSEPCRGTVTDIDVPGDANMGNHVVGRDPWSAFMIGAEVYVANRDDKSISFYSPLISGSQPSALLLPSRPIFIGSRQSSAVYAALPESNTLGVIDATTAMFTQGLPVGANPVALVQLPDASKIYVVNQGDASVSVFSGTGPTPLKTITGLVANPVWAIATPDSKYVFVLSRGDTGDAASRATVAVISTATNSVLISTAVGAASAVPTDVPLQNPMVYDSSTVGGQHLYVTNPTDSSVVILDTSSLGAPTPTMPATTVSVAPGMGPFSVAVAHLTPENPSTDVVRAYTLNSGNGTVPPSVSVIDAKSLTVTQVLDSSATTGTFLPSGPRAIVASSDGSKVYVANHEPTFDTEHPEITSRQPGISIIRTSDNTASRAYVKAPFQDPVGCKFDTPQPWIANHPYNPGDTVIPTASTAGANAYQSTTTGTSGSSAPNFSACTGDATSTVNPATCTVSDGTVVWRPVGNYNVCPRQRPSFLFAQ